MKAMEPRPMGETLDEVMARFRALAEDAPTEDDLHEQIAADRKATRQARGAAYVQAFEASLPDGYAHCVATPLDVDRHNQRAVEAADSLTPGASLFLHGDAGVGKTHLAILTATRLARSHGLKPHFWSWPRLMDRMRDFRNTSRMPSIAEPDILIADDLDKGAETPWVYERVYELMQRVFDGKVTIVTANRSPGQTAMKFGLGDEQNTAALASRFRLFDVASMGGRDRR